MLSDVRRIIAAAHSEQPVSNVRPLTEILADDTAPRRVQLRVLTILSAIALLIAGVGVAVLVGRAMSELLFAVAPTDAQTISSPCRSASSPRSSAAFVPPASIR